MSMGHNLGRKMEDYNDRVPSGQDVDFGNVDLSVNTIVGAAGFDANGASNGIILDADGDTKIASSTDDAILFTVGGDDAINIASNFLAIQDDWLLRYNVEALAAAGSSISDAAQIAQQIVRVTGADGAVGVKLPALIAADGRIYYVINDGTANLLLYPGSGDDFNAGTASAPLTVLPGGAVLCFGIDSSTWGAVGVGANVKSNVSVTATVGGGTTGLIPKEADFVTVTSDNADKQISLPAATIGKQMVIKVGATACELISAVVADKVNNVVVGATNELALTASATYYATYVAADNWVIHGRAITGADIADAALVPNTL